MFLWHFPSARLEPGVPDVIRHTALRSSDFPPPTPEGAEAAVRSGCLHFNYTMQLVESRASVSVIVECKRFCSTRDGG